MANLKVSENWEVTRIKCLGEVHEHYTLHNLESAIGCWLFVYGEHTFDKGEYRVIGSFALVPNEYVNDCRFVGADIRKFEISDTYGAHILANCSLITRNVL